MGKKSIKGYLKSMEPEMNILRSKVRVALKAHPEMFHNVNECPDSQVCGFSFSVSFERKKSTGELSLLCMDAWLGHVNLPHSKMRVDWEGEFHYDD